MHETLTAPNGNGKIDRSSQGKGWMVSLMTHIIFLALLFIPMLASTPPQEEEEGLLVSLGLPDEGQGEQAPLNE